MMNVWLDAAVTLLAVIGFYALLGLISDTFIGGKKSELYVYFSEDGVTNGKADIVIFSEEERILKALSEEYEKLYIMKGTDEWITEKTKSKDVSKK